MARPQAHPHHGRTHPLPMRPHHPGGRGTFNNMPPPCGHGHTSGLVPGGNPTATRRLAGTQPRRPGHRTPLQGSTDQGGHYERGSDTGPATAPHQTRGEPDGGSSTPPARGGPQSSGPNGTTQAPPVHTHRTTHGPHRQGTHADLIHYHAVHDPEVHEPALRPTHAPHLRPQASNTPPEHPRRPSATRCPRQRHP